MTLRPRFRRDSASLHSLLKTWTESGDRDTGIVTADALREAGYRDAADDLDWSLKNHPRLTQPRRRSLRNRVLSEVSGGRVLQRGVWDADTRYPGRQSCPRSFVAIYEYPKHRIVLWERLDNPGTWDRWGIYNTKDFLDEQKMFSVLRSDIRYESLPIEVRILERVERSRAIRRRAAP